ncbi:MAG: hypothetical protein LBQ83_07430 [Candidatus Margulisbacteria bacterium]|jgi:hypothetical protein|nr:hypothetical protein [Candidatus Margulisiibacteriota bacterium]
MKKIQVDTRKRRSLIKNFKALAFLSACLLPFSLGLSKTAAVKGSSEKNPAIWG